MDTPAFPWLEPDSSTETVPLRNVFLHVTKACNLYCKYCYFSASRPLPDEMRTEEFMRLWSHIVAIRPQKVIFTGGEPLLRPDILDLLQGLKEADPQHHVLRCLNTNGHLVTPELAKQLVGLADEVRVSLDALRERNDALRGKGNFDAAVRALETYYAVGFEPKVLVTVTAHGLPDLEELLVFLIQKKLTRINLNAFRPVGRGKKYAEWRANAHKAREAVQRAWLRCYPDQSLPPDPPESESCANCGVGQFLNIMPNGDVFPCHVLTSREFRCGNVREQSLLEICRKQGLLGQLAKLDFHDLAEEDENLVDLTQANTCMGPVYRDTKSSPTWRTRLSLTSR
ncbi:radical SAM protein [Aggregatilinea lenta]|uniref:radical SAM protein n=1 Tax=Aggregatilinea lenta TaxID=913108 RepID=UPI000E5AF033|nr:radical SAM protein [Aggregatilinea lenta]